MSLGYTGLVELEPLKSWDPRSGTTLTQRWRGTRAVCDAYSTILKQRGVAHSLDDEPGGLYWIISAKASTEDSTPTAEPIATLWRLRSAEIQIALWSCKQIQDQLALLPFDGTTNRDDASKLRTWFDAYLSGARTVEGPTGDTLPIDASILQTLVTSLGMTWTPFDLLIQARFRGAESFQRHVPILQRTVILTGNTIYKADLTKQDKVIATDLLKVQEKFPDNVPFALPTGYWLRGATEADQSASDKWMITDSWEFSKAFEALGYEQITS